MISFVITALVVAVLTWLLGWWGVVVAALGAGALLWRRRAGAWLVALAAVVAWGSLLVMDSIGGRFATLAASLAGGARAADRRAALRRAARVERGGGGGRDRTARARETSVRVIARAPATRGRVSRRANFAHA